MEFHVSEQFQLELHHERILRWLYQQYRGGTSEIRFRATRANEDGRLREMGIRDLRDLRTGSQYLEAWGRKHFNGIPPVLVDDTADVLGLTMVPQVKDIYGAYRAWKEGQ